jgi:type 1 fimbria pilin
MRKSLIAAALALALGASAAHAQGTMKMPEAPKGKDVTITGMVVDVSCKFGQGLSGASHLMCAQVCADKGIPLAILTSDGKLYIPTSAAMPGDAQNPLLKEYAEQEVTVTGKAFSAGGAEAIQIATIKKKA